jgi:ABC-type multidrug transport system fused ATPase/permease subunit
MCLGVSDLEVSCHQQQRHVKKRALIVLQEFHFLWAAPFEALTILVLVGTDVGWWMLPAFGLVFFVIFIQYYFGWRIAVNKYKNSEYISQRCASLLPMQFISRLQGLCTHTFMLNVYLLASLAGPQEHAFACLGRENFHLPTSNSNVVVLCCSGSITQEILPSMKLVKYYGWESFFERKIMGIRKKEERLAVYNNILKTINICLVFSIPPTCAFAIFASYEFNVERVSSTLAFVTLTLFNIMRFPLVVLPKALRAASEAASSLARVEKYLIEASALDESKIDKNSRGIDIKNALFQFDGHDGHGFKLNVPEFNVAPGEVVAVVGRVGAGKTALLQALMGHMPKKSGTMHVGGQLAYVPQTAWIQNLTLRENILFGKCALPQRLSPILS